MELTKEIKEILEDIVWWETCPTDYKFKINAYLKSVNDSEALSIHDVSEILEFAKREKRIAEGASEECIQELENEEQSLIYTGQAQAYEELITWLSSR